MMLQAMQLKPWQQGITLIEMMVVTMLLALMSTMGWQLVSDLTRLQDAQKLRATDALRIDTILQQVAADLAQADSLSPTVDLTGSVVVDLRQPVLRVERHGFMEEASDVVYWRLEADGLQRDLISDQMQTDPFRLHQYRPTELRLSPLAGARSHLVGPGGAGAAKQFGILISLTLENTGSEPSKRHRHTKVAEVFW